MVDVAVGERNFQSAVLALASVTMIDSLAEFWRGKAGKDNSSLFDNDWTVESGKHLGLTLKCPCPSWATLGYALASP
mgnify:CR=1 FL=1